jgi:pimeloyl-ACP methyl ester carboxylesterase
MNWRDWQARQQVVELGEHFLSYVEVGEGRPLVWLHGIPTWGFLWNGLAPALASTHRVLVPDLLGYGFSDRRDGFDRALTRQADALDAWMERLGVEGAGVVAHDFGGGVAQHLAVHYPRRVERLCLMDSVCYDAWPGELMVQLGHPGSVRRLSAQAVQRLLKLGMKRAGFAQGPPEGLVEGLLAPYATEVGKVSLVRNAASLNTNQTLELAPRLGRLGVPVLILWGEDDVFLSPDYGERLAWDIPGARFVKVPGAKHFVMWDAPDTVATELFRFLGQELPEEAVLPSARPAEPATTH